MSLFTEICLFISTIIHSGVEAENLTKGMKALVNKLKDSSPQVNLGKKGTGNKNSALILNSKMIILLATKSSKM